MTGTGTSGTIKGATNLQFNGSTLELTGAYRLKHDLSYLASSVTGYGDILKIGTGTLVAGNVYYLNASQVWTATDSDVVASSDGLLGIALGTSPTTNGVLIRGYARNASWTFATGAKLYLKGTPSDLTNIAPTASGSVIRIVGYQIDNSLNKIYFNPSNEWLEN
jgi:hypothetical protein